MFQLSLVHNKGTKQAIESLSNTGERELGIAKTPSLLVKSVFIGLMIQPEKVKSHGEQLKPLGAPAPSKVNFPGHTRDRIRGQQSGHHREARPRPQLRS